jgi:protein O-mannosyl-transferase
MRRFFPGFFLIFALVVAFLVYQRGLTGPFLFDDGPNIVYNGQLAIHDLSPDSLRQLAFSGFSGPLKRPVSMTSFAVNLYATGLDPFYFKLTNLCIHLLNGVGIFVLTSLLLNFYRQRFQPELSAAHVQWISVAVSAAWLLHPFNLTSVLYVVQRMTSLSALFTIWGLALFFRGRTRLYQGKNGIFQILGSLLLFTPLAVLSKENGILLPGFMLVAELTLFRFYTGRPAQKRFLTGFYLLAVAVPLAAVLIYISMHPEWLQIGYKGRDFTMVERVLTEARVLWFYIWQIVLPSTAQMGLYHDDIAISRGLFQPASTVISLAGLIALLGLSFVARRKAPLIGFAILFFLAGHLLESTVFPLEIAHEHRNYLPMYGIVLVMFFYLLYPLAFKTNLRLRQAGAILLIALFAFNTFSRAGKWTNPYDLFMTEVEHHPSSALANGEMGAVYSNINTKDPIGMEMYYLLARERYEKAAMLDRNDTKPLFGLIMLSAGRKKAMEPSWLEELAHRLEHSPYAAVTSDKLVSLTNCRLEGRCKLTGAEIEGLLNAALHNPGLGGANRAKVLYAQSVYLINVKRDYPAALATMHQMVESAPQELDFRLPLINFLVALKRAPEAKAELEMLKRLDKWHAHMEEIKLLDKQLSGQSNDSSQR